MESRASGVVHNEGDVAQSKHLINVLSKAGVLGWYNIDEAVSHNHLQAVIARYHFLLKQDPYHLQFACDNHPAAWDILSAYADVLMPDVYPQHKGDMRIVGRAVAYARELKGGRAAVWPVIQAFQLCRYGRTPDGSRYDFGRLNIDEMRCIVYDAVICGATGINYYSYYTSEGPQDLPNGKTRRYYIMDDFPDQWEAITRINHELGEIAPALTSGRKLTTSVEPVESDVHASAFVDAQRVILLVANPTRGQQSVVVGVTGLHDQTGSDLFSNEQATSKQGRITLTLAPLAAHAFGFTLP